MASSRRKLDLKAVRSNGKLGAGGAFAFKANIERDVRALHDQAAALARRLGFEGNDKQLLAAIELEEKFYEEQFEQEGRSDDAGDICLSERGPWTRRFEPALVSRILCLGSLRVTLAPYKENGGDEILEWIDDIDGCCMVLRREGSRAATAPGLPKHLLKRLALRAEVEHQIVALRLKIEECEKREKSLAA
jgi:hypothetical protein